MIGLHPITIVGGGLAGLTLGISLRQRGVPVTVYEAGSYPRHRVCGEFISGNGIDVLHALGLHVRLMAAGAVEARTATFHTQRRSYPPRPLPRPALCLSRHVLDDLLAREFRALGGELRERERFSAPYDVGIVRATGRRLETRHTARLRIGLKAHALGATLRSDLEMHFVPGGYVGLCRLPGSQVNVCGLFTLRGPVHDLASRWRDWLTGPKGSALHQRLCRAAFVEGSFCAVSGLDLRPSRAHGAPQCRVGDALTMIPPLTGNGMSMAFEAAACATGPLAAFAEGAWSWDAARLAVARSCDAAFARRLRWARWLQLLVAQPCSRGLLLALADACHPLWRGWFRHTR